ASRIGPQPVEGDAARDRAQPRSRRAAPRVEAAPRAKSLLEGLGGDVLGRGTVAGQVDDVRVDGVELPGDDLGEAGAGGDGCRQGRRGRVHARLYGAAPAIRHTAQGRLKSMRRLLVLAAALVLVDTMLYAALTPL